MLLAQAQLEKSITIELKGKYIYDFARRKDQLRSPLGSSKTILACSPITNLSEHL